jgi:predicted HTH domain antitoxin
MKSITFNIPEMSDLDSKELSMMVAAQLYEKGKLSLGQAADVAGYSKRTFAELLGKYNVSIFNYPSTDLSTDVANA